MVIYIHLEENQSPTKKRKLNKKSKPNRVIKALGKEENAEVNIIKSKKSAKVSTNFVRLKINNRKRRK